MWEILAANAADMTKEHYVVASVDAPIGNLKLRPLRDGAVALVVTGSVGDDGCLYNDEKVEKKSTGQVFDSARIHFVSSRGGRGAGASLHWQVLTLPVG